MTKPSSAAALYTLHSDVAYAAPVGRAHLLDLYVPTSGRGPFPVVIYQAGSAFRSDDTKSGPPSGDRRSATGGGPAGSSDSSSPGVGTPEGCTSSRSDGGGRGVTAGLGGLTTAAKLAQTWGAHGYAIVGLNVRSSAQATFPAQVHDVKAAIRFLRAHADAYRLDRARFATMGTSSGGWVATMAATTDAVAALEGDLGNPGQSSTVRAVIDLFGPTDFSQMDSHRLPGGPQHDPGSSPESQLMGFALQTDPAAVAEANPAAYVHRTSPPAYIIHGTADPLVPHHQSQLLFAAYEQAGATAILTLVPATGHTDSYLASAHDSEGRIVNQTSGGTTTTGTDPAPTYATLLTFLDAHLLD